MWSFQACGYPEENIRTHMVLGMVRAHRINDIRRQLATWQGGPLWLHPGPRLSRENHTGQASENGGRAHLLKKELREAEHFLSLLPIVFQKCFSTYFNLSWVQSFPKEEHWPLCGSWVYCYLYLWGSSSHRLGTISHIMSSWPHNTYLCVLLWCSFRDFQMFIPTKHLGPTHPSSHFVVCL